MRRIGISLFLLLCLLGGSLWAQQEGLRVFERMDWEQGALILEIAMAMEPRQFDPGSRFEVEREIERLLPGLFMSAVIQIPFDSYRTIAERIKEDRQLFRRLESTAAASSIKHDSRVRADLQEVQLSYRFPMYGEGGFANHFITHSQVVPVHRKLGFVPTRNFSGLIIYAGGQLPAHGKDIRQKIQPAVFPTLYDEQMNLVLSVEMCDPEYLRRWGMVAYTDSEQDSAFLQRVGATPLRTVARGVFGINATDLLLPREAVDRLLVREANRRMLSEGRILIVVDGGQPNR